MDFRVLGPVCVATPGRDVTPSSGRHRRVLAALVSHADDVVPVAALIDAVWGDDPPASAKASLQSHVSRLRSLLAELDNGATPPIESVPGGYRLRLRPTDTIDAQQLAAALRSARDQVAADPLGAVTLADEALALWRGPPYADAADAVPEEVTRLWSVRRALDDVRVEGWLGGGRPGDALPHLEAQLAQDPLDERAVGHLLLALHLTGREGVALERYHAFRNELAEQLGVDPSPWLQERYEAVLRHEVDLPAPGAGERGPAVDATAEDRHRSPLVGRDAAVTAVAAAVSTAPLVTLTGPGGVGKTRLAEAAAQRLRPEVDDVVTLELAALRDPSALDDAVARGCGAAPGADLPARDRVVTALRSRRTLLIVDNCEHLLAPVGVLLEHLLQHCPRLRVLATSRERLGVPAERRWPVPPLPAPTRDPDVPLEDFLQAPAVRVFLERAGAADPDFAVTEENRAAVADVCRRLDCLPLALELAGGCAAGLDVHDLASRLDDRFTLLTTGPRGEAGRHRTLRDVVGWSYDLLRTEQADLFDRVSVFAGGFTLDAAEAIAHAPPAPTDGVATTLAGLVDCSMVQRTGTRYSVLETLRLHGAHRLRARDLSETAERAHATHFAALGDQAWDGVRGPDDLHWVRRIEAEIDNLRSAHRWAVERGESDLALRLSAPLAPYADWWLVDEVPRWAEEAAALPDAVDHPLFPIALGCAARGAGNRGQLERSVALSMQALAAAPDPADARRLLPLRALSLARFYNGHLDTSADLEDEILSLAQAHDDRYHVIYAWVMRALILTYQHRPESANQAAATAAAHAESLGNTHLRSAAAYCRGEALAPADPDAALPWLERAVALAHESGALLAEAIALVTRSSVRAEQGDPAAALETFSTAIDRLRRGGNWTHQWTTLRNLVFLLTRLEADPPAAALLGALRAAATAPRAYGTDAARLQRVAAALEERLGADAFGAATERGHAMTDVEAVDTALAAIDELRGSAH